jgi:nitrate reductase gamma subunit
MRIKQDTNANTPKILSFSFLLFIGSANFTLLIYYLIFPHSAFLLSSRSFVRSANISHHRVHNVCVSVVVAFQSPVLSQET